jgi:hypothetical protein
MQRLKNNLSSNNARTTLETTMTNAPSTLTQMNTCNMFFELISEMRALSARVIELEEKQKNVDAETAKTIDFLVEKSLEMKLETFNDRMLTMIETSLEARLSVRDIDERISKLVSERIPEKFNDHLTVLVNAAVEAKLGTSLDATISKQVEQYMRESYSLRSTIKSMIDSDDLDLKECVSEAVGDYMYTREFTRAVSEAVENAVGDADFTDALESWASNHDFSSDIESAIESAIDNHDFSSAIDSALDSYDFAPKIESEVERYIERYDFSNDIDNALDNYDLTDRVIDIVEDKYDRKIEKRVAEIVEEMSFGSVEKNAAEYAEKRVRQMLISALATSTQTSTEGASHV